MSAPKEPVWSEDRVPVPAPCGRRIDNAASPIGLAKSSSAASRHSGARAKRVSPESMAARFHFTKAGATARTHHIRLGVWIPGSRSARPGMTEERSGSDRCRR